MLKWGSFLTGQAGTMVYRRVVRALHVNLFIIFVNIYVLLLWDNFSKKNISIIINYPKSTRKTIFQKMHGFKDSCRGQLSV